MGSNSTKAHEVFTVAPTDPGDETQAADEPLDDDAAAESPVPGLAHTLDLIDGLPQHSDKVHDDLVWLVATAHAEIDALEADEADKQQWRTLVAAKAAGKVTAIDGQSLAAVQAAEQQLAAATPPAVAAWQVSPAEVAAAMGTLQQRLVELHQPGPGVGVTPRGRRRPGRAARG